MRDFAVVLEPIQVLVPFAAKWHSTTVGSKSCAKVVVKLQGVLDLGRGQGKVDFAVAL